jgi:ABC-2 type transport system permease protein
VTLLASQIGYQLRVLVRTPLGSFFVFVVPLMLLLAINLLNSSLRLPSRGGIRFAEFFTPATAAFAVINACFINIAVSATHARDAGILKRLRTTPLPPWIYLTARIASAAVVSVLSVAAVFTLGIALFDVDVPWMSLPGTAVVVTAGILCFCALGFAVTILIPDADAAVAVAYGIVLPLSFISDVFLPVDAAPGWLRTAAAVFPVEHLARALENLWQPAASASPMQWGHLAVLLAWAAGAFLVALRWFRWQPHEG